MWEDEETQSFYETLVDLKAFIPAILYKDSSAAGNEKTPAEEEDPAALEATEEDFESEMVVDDEGEIAPPDLEDDADDGETQNASNKMLLDAFLANLPTCVSRDMIDNAAAEFCMNLNTKNNRKKLVK